VEGGCPAARACARCVCPGPAPGASRAPSCNAPRACAPWVQHPRSPRAPRAPGGGARNPDRARVARSDGGPEAPRAHALAERPPLPCAGKPLARPCGLRAPGASPGPTAVLPLSYAGPTAVPRASLARLVVLSWLVPGLLPLCSPLPGFHQQPGPLGADGGPCKAGSTIQRFPPKAGAPREVVRETRGRGRCVAFFCGPLEPVALKSGPWRAEPGPPCSSMVASW
jgi:hypothetical protein